jgi:V8-like Glu-specific endopeptidase
MSTNQRALSRALPRIAAALTRRPSRRLALLLTTTIAALAAAVAVASGPSSAATSGTRIPDAVRTAGLPSVGALFTVDANGSLGTHFCTASVVDSPAKDLVVTAAHCLSGREPSQVVFVPEYHSGATPYGVWDATAFYLDKAWQASASPDDDFAFLSVEQTTDPKPVQAVTGGNSLGIDLRPGTPAPLLKVVGYPDQLDTPIDCASQLKLFSPSELEFDCGGYTTGTSGSPFVVNERAATHTGTVIGVIGGYEQGGDSPSVSYAARFEANTRALYQLATAG